MKRVKVERSAIRNHSSNIDNATVDQRLETYLTEHPMITRRKLEELCGLTRTTASRHISRLIAENKIKNINTRTQPIYVKA